MTYYINPMWFYLMNVGDSLKNFLFITGISTLLVAGLLCVMWYADDCVDVSDMDDDEKKVFCIFKKFIVASIIAIVIGIFVPSKETCIEMMVASQVTHENVTATKEEIYEIVDYITDKVKGEEWHTH